MAKIVCICGYETLGDYFVNNHGYTKIAFAELPENPDKPYVITDVRCNKELEIIKKNNGISIKVKTDGNNIDQLETDCVIKHNGTLEQLYEKIDNIIAFKMYCKYVKIGNFDDIKLIDENTLYVFDIDETLMVYDGIDRKWWKKKMVENHENEHLVIDEWLKQIENHEPKHTHASSFNTFLENVNKSNIVCLTARKESLRNITEQHLAKIGVKNIPVYYSYGSCKGKVLKEIIIPNYPTINNIVFVDDNKNNISSVNKEFYNENIKVQCYYFVHNL